MKDDNIKVKVARLTNLIKDVNSVMKELHQLRVEVRISYKDSSSGAPEGIPCLELWRATEHNDYLKDE